MASFSTASQKRQSGGPLLFSASEPMPAVTVSFILCGGARGPWRRKVIGASSATALAGLPSDRRTCPERRGSSGSKRRSLEMMLASRTWN